MVRQRKSSTSKSSGGSNTDFKEIIKKITGVQELDNYVSMITYGRSGTGKTTFASTWPKPMLLLDIKDDGTDSIKDIEGVDVLTIDNWDDFERIYWFLKSGDHEYKSIHIDTVTQLQDKCKDHVTKGARMVTQNQWGEIAGMMGTWVMNYRDLTEEKIHVHFIAQDRLTESDTDEEEDNQIDPIVGPRLMPSLASKVNAAVKVIGNTYISEVVSKEDNKMSKADVFRMRLGPHAYYITKIRKPKKAKMPSYIDDPTFDTIMDIMQGNYKKAATGTKKPASDKVKRKKKTT